MIAVPENFAGLPAREVAHLLARAQLERATDAAARLARGEDGEALHDFRVALRRLRSLLRLLRAELQGTVRRRHRRVLREFSERTSGERDAEVQLAWLTQCRPQLRPADRNGARWLAARLEARLRPENGESSARVAKTFAKAAAKLASRLDGGLLTPAADAGAPAPSYAVTAAAQLRVMLEECRLAVGGLSDPFDAPAIHAARLALKRLRYLLEPWADCDPAAAPLLGRLKPAQDQLGEMHDRQVLLSALREAHLSAAAEKARNLFELSLPDADDAALRRVLRREPRRGLIALARLAHRELTSRFERFAAEAREEPPGFLSGVDDFARHLEESPSRPQLAAG